MNVKNYINKKALGLAEVITAGGGYAISVKRFSQEDGRELNPEIESVNVTNLNQRKTELESELEDCKTMINDIGVLKKK